MTKDPEPTHDSMPGDQTSPLSQNRPDAEPETVSNFSLESNPEVQQDSTRGPEESALEISGSPTSPTSETLAKHRINPLIWILAGAALLVILAAGGGFIWLRSLESTALKQGQDNLLASNWAAAESSVDQALQYRSTGLLANPLQLVLVRGEARFHLGKADLAMADLEEAKAVDPASAQPYLFQAHIQYDRGNIDQALVYANDAQERDDKLGFPYALQAFQVYQKNDYNNAFSLANKAIERDAKLDKAFFIRGTILSMRGDSKAAIKDLDRALELKPKDAEALAWRSFTYYQDYQNANSLADAKSAQAIAPESAAGFWAQAIENMIAYKYEDSLANINKAINLDGGRPEFLLLRGLSYYKTINIKDSLEDFDKALQLAPDYVWAIFEKAGLLLSRNEEVNIESEANRILAINSQSEFAPFILAQEAYHYVNMGKALEELNQTLLLAPGNFSAFIRRGFIYIHQRDFAKANADCSKALEIWPNSNGALICLATIEAGQKNYDKAIGMLDQAFGINPLNSDALALKAKVLLQKEEKDQAKAVLNAALKIDPDSPTTLIVHSMWAIASHDQVQAMSDVNKALEKSPKDTDVLIARGFVHMDEGKTDQVIEDAQAVLKINSRLPDPQYLLYDANMKLDKRLEALANAKTAADLDPANPLAYQNLGEVYQKSGNNELAIKNLQKSVDLDPTNDTALALLTQAYQETGDYEAAIKTIDKLLALKSQLSQDQIDLLQQTRDFLVTIPAAVNGQRTVKNEELNFTITYPVSWVPRPIKTDNIALSLDKMKDVDTAASSLFIQFFPFDPNSSDAYVPISAVADDVSQVLKKAYSSYKFISRTQFQAKNLNGIADTFEETRQDAEGNDEKVIARYYYFKSENDFILCGFFSQSDEFAANSDEADQIVATFGLLK